MPVAERLIDVLQLSDYLSGPVSFFFWTNDFASWSLPGAGEREGGETQAVRLITDKDLWLHCIAAHYSQLNIYAGWVVARWYLLGHFLCSCLALPSSALLNLIVFSRAWAG